MVARWRRRVTPILVGLAALAAVLVGQSVQAPVASAAPVQVGWYANAYGSFQLIRDANHWWAEEWNSSGQHIGRAFDVWLPYYCNDVIVESGNFWTHQPARVYFGNIDSEGPIFPSENGYRGCYKGNTQTTYQGWAEVYVFPRGCSNDADCNAWLGQYSGANYFNTGTINQYNTCTWWHIQGNCTKGEHYWSYYEFW